jgi:O-antigen/teichoic acid export membrane protein
MFVLGKWFELNELGTYGLVASFVAIAIPLLGFRFDYIISREIINLTEPKIAIRMRDQVLVYGFTYVVMIVACLYFWQSAFDINRSSIITYAVILAILESLATLGMTNLISLNRPIVANILFFIRSSAWIPFFLVFIYVFPSGKKIETILSFWIFAIALSLIINLWLFRKMLCKSIFTIPFDIKSFVSCFKECLPLWISSISVAAVANLDRFFVEIYLGRDLVGIASFYSSIVVTLPAILNSSVLFFIYPSMVSANNNGDNEQFLRLFRNMFKKTFSLTTILSLGLIGFVPLIAVALGKYEFTKYLNVLWLIIFASWMRCTSEPYYYYLYAKNMDRQIWLSNLIVLLISSISNYYFVSFLGLIGIGLSGVVSSFSLFLARRYCVTKTI